jgi:hypothetical protein
MNKKVKFDVWMETGVCVSVPAGTKPETDAGMELIKAAAIKRFIELLNSNSVDLAVEPFDAE